MYMRIVPSTSRPTQIACEFVQTVAIARHHKWLCRSAGQAFAPTRAGIAILLTNHAAHARARMQNEACAHSALCRREEVVVEERHVDLDLTSALGALGMVLCTRESEWVVSCALGKG